MTPFPQGHPKQRQRYRSAFSLVEVALALGVVSFALVSMMGLLVIGADHSRSARERTLEVQMLEWAHTRAKAAWEEGTLSMQSQTLEHHFDADGLAVDAAAPPASIVFRAVVAPFEQPLPGSSRKLFGVSVKILARDQEVLGNHAIWFSK